MKSNFAIRKSKLFNTLSSKDKQAVNYIRQALKIIDLLFQKQLKNISQSKIRKNILENESKNNANLLSYYTIIEETHGKLNAIPYHRYFNSELKEIAQLLIQAAQSTSFLKFREFLRKRANSLVTDRFDESETMWVNLPILPLNLTIGPMLSYHDEMFAVKKFYTGVLMLTDIEKSKNLRILCSKKARNIYSKSIKISAPYSPAQEIFDIGDVDSWSGEVAKLDAGAWSRPSDQGFQHIIKKYGTRKIIFENVITYRVDHLDYDLFKTIYNVDKNLTKKKMKQYHVLETLLHEIGHTYAKYKYIDERFQEYHHSFEELKADIFALHHIPRLVEFNIIPKNEEKIVFEAALSDFLGRLHLSLHIEQRKHHGFSAKVIYNILIEHQALLKRENKFILDYPKAQKVIANYFIFLQKFLFDAENKEIANYIETMNSSVITKNLINHLKLFKSDFYTHQNS